jgi:2-polyprenyl-3-methyl-5-hydroxy-6-metoxy-1,4-benzoquinol methylase
MNSCTESTVNRQTQTRSTGSAGYDGEDSSRCWNCGCEKFESLFEAHDFDTADTGFPVRRCRQCGLVYTAGVTEEILAAAYSHSYYGSGKAKFLSVIETLVRIGHHRQAKHILGLYRDQQSGSKVAGRTVSVLDIGCGRALLLQEFNKLGADCLGIERSEFPGSEGVEVAIHTGALQDAELADKRFDIIVIWHVLEHITELGSLLEELPRHLNPGGLLVVSVPNYSSWQGRFFKQHWFHLDIPRHVTHFEQQWLEKNLGSMGLEIISLNTFTASQNVYGFIQSSLNRLMPRRPNRLYKLLTRGRGRQDWLALAGWSLLALPLLPFAILESVLSELSSRGATLTIYARNRQGDRQVADILDP